jgi:DNA-binding response OmpR family regulator
MHAAQKSERIVRVLVAEDDTALRSVLERGLRENGYVVDSVGDGSAALRHLHAYEYDVAVLDWRMPEHTGVEVIQEARRAGDRTPILMLTARDTASDRVTGLDSGADDYLVKPFDISELFARIRALQRRPPLTTHPVLECADLRFDPATRVVSVLGQPIATTAIETSLIELLLRRSPAVVTRRMIALQVWNDEADAVGSNTIDVHVGRVRAKLSGSRSQIETVRGLGYRMSEG